MEKKEKPKMETYKFESEQEKLFKDPAYKAEVRKFRKEKERMYQEIMNECKKQKELNLKKNEVPQQKNLVCMPAKINIIFQDDGYKQKNEGNIQMKQNTANIEYVPYVPFKDVPFNPPRIASKREYTLFDCTQEMFMNLWADHDAGSVSKKPRMEPEEEPSPFKIPKIDHSKNMVKDMCVQTMPENIFAKPMTECVSNEAGMVTTASGPGPSNVSNNDSNFVECPMDFDGNDIIGYSPAWKFDILPDGTFKTSTIYDPLRDGHVPLVAREVSVTDGPLILLVGDEEGQVHYNHKDRVQMDIGNSTLHVLDPTEEAVLLVNEKVPLDLNELIVNTPIGQESQGSQTDEHADVENSYSNSNSSGDQKKSRIAFEQLDIELPTDKKYLKQTII